MRLRSIHAQNVLTFEDLQVPVESEGLTVFVGPNGSGKTNLFRVVHQTVEAIRECGPSGQGVPGPSLATLESWVRDPLKPLVIELDVEWRDPEERALLTQFLALALADPPSIQRGLGKLPTGFEGREAWRRFVEALPKVLKPRHAAVLFRGIIGLRYQRGSASTLYYRLHRGEKLPWILYPRDGLTPRLLDEPLSSWTTLPLAQMWVESIEEDTRELLRKFLSTEGVPKTGLPPVAFSWRDTLETAKARGSQALSRDWSLEVSVGPHNSPQHQLLRKFRETLGIVPPRDSATLVDVLALLLAGRITITEDLLSPPEDLYRAAAWWDKATPLSSRHLGAHLLSLKLGDDENRRQFSTVQRMFKGLTGRSLDLTVQPKEIAEGEPEVTEQRIVIVQQHTTGDHASVPLRTSGSGLVELAYLASALSLPEHHVLLLDEPGRALHPQALLALRRLLYDRQEPSVPSQRLMITHSPYLVPTAALEHVRRLYRDAHGLSQVAQLDSLSHQHQGRRQSAQAQERQDRWGRSANWPALLFSTVVLIVDGETEYGALPVWYEKLCHEPPEARGISILYVGGKASNGRAMRELDSFCVPWVALVDGDSLKRGADNSGNIWGELAVAKRLTRTKANLFRNLTFPEQVQRLRDDYLVWVSGSDENGNFETMLGDGYRLAQSPSGLHGKVLRARWYAQANDCPEFLEPILGKVRQLAGADGPDSFEGGA